MNKAQITSGIIRLNNWLVMSADLQAARVELAAARSMVASPMRDRMVAEITTEEAAIVADMEAVLRDTGCAEAV